MNALTSLTVRTLITLLGLLVCASVALAQPNAPSGLSVVPRYQATIDLSLRWQDNSNNEDGFEIERREQGGAAFGLIGTVGQNVTTHVDNTATADKYWEYRVRATSAALSNSGYSNISHATSPKQVWPTKAACWSPSSAANGIPAPIAQPDAVLA